MTLQFFLQNAWRWKVGLPEKEWIIDTTGFEDHSWKNDFEKLRENRLLIAQLRYGKNGVKGKKLLRVKAMIHYLEEYERTGNGECLVDVANYCALEFFDPMIPNFHFEATDDKYHAKTIT